jgi:hypothetical protein
MHYPMDTLFGLAAGAALVLVIVGIFLHPVSLGIRWLGATPLGVLVRAPAASGARQTTAESVQEGETP